MALIDCIIDAAGRSQQDWLAVLSQLLPGVVDPLLPQGWLATASQTAAGS